MTWLLPALLAAAQIALWPGLALARGERVDPATAAAVATIAVGLAAALVLRRRAPVAVTAAAVVGISLGAWVAPAQVFFAPGDAVAVNAITDHVALFSVAVLRSRRTTALVAAGLLLWQAALSAVVLGVTADYPLDMVLAAGAYTVVAAAGRVRRRWVADRAAAAHRLAEAERARRHAADTERRRLARELHDVTAHHLTSIVVNASAAQFLAAGRPELPAEALDFAARAGRETLADLHRLVAVLPFAAPASTLTDLADDFRHLGQLVTVETSGDPPPAIAATLHAIAREALTNTLRYAPGGTVRLIQTYVSDAATLVVEDDGPATSGAGLEGGRTEAGPDGGSGGAGPDGGVAGLGGGRGVAGMRERAEALGGTLEAGERDGGGWRVRAAIPVRSGVRRRRGWASQTVLDVGVVLLAMVLPLGGVTVAVEEGATPAVVTLLLLTAIAQSAPLLVRRRRPWAAFAAVAVTSWLAPLLVVADALAAPDVFLFGLVPTLVVVYAVAAGGVHSWLAPLISIASSGLSFSLLMTADSDIDAGGVGVVAVVLFGGAAVAVILVPPIAGAWLAGHLVRRRRRRRHDREVGGVAVEAMRAEENARLERARVADGLRAAILAHAARVPRAAEEADLPGVLDAARASLAAMRELLDGLASRPQPPGTGSQAAGDGLGGRPPGVGSGLRAAGDGLGGRPRGVGSGLRAAGNGSGGQPPGDGSGLQVAGNESGSPAAGGGRRVAGPGSGPPAAAEEVPSSPCG